MATPAAEQAILDSLNRSKAILKVISPNDVDKPNVHQCGYYLPKPIWRYFTAIPPDKNLNAEEEVTVLWQDGRETASRIKWYGKGTRSEYRITRFGKDFPWRTIDNIGSLLVLIPDGTRRFLAYVLDTEEDIEEIQSALGVEIIGSWAVYDAEAEPVENPEECVSRQFREFIAALDHFPTTGILSTKARNTLRACVADFDSYSSDKRLLKWLESEYELFRMLERRLYQNEITRLFRSVDDFLSTASQIMNRRKSRAGHSLENHVHQLLTDANIPFSFQSRVDGKPDFIIPGQIQYEDREWPINKICILAVKRTCKDRWRQITHEAKRVPCKHLLTIQNSISVPQLTEMKEANVTLIVPKHFQKEYPRDRPAPLLSVDEFIDSIRRMLN